MMLLLSKAKLQGRDGQLHRVHLIASTLSSHLHDYIHTLAQSPLDSFYSVFTLAGLYTHACPAWHMYEDAMPSMAHS